MNKPNTLINSITEEKLSVISVELMEGNTAKKTYMSNEKYPLGDHRKNWNIF